MQDAYKGSWARESHLSAADADSLRYLNHRFLDLAGHVRRGWRGDAPAALVADQVAPLSASQRAAAADCPYALFDLRFQDEAHWRARLLRLDDAHVADEPTLQDDAAGVDHGEVSRFVQLALFYAWHVAAGRGLAAQLLLGMRTETVAAFGRITVNDLPVLAATEAVHLAPRWGECSAYWSALTRAASPTDRTALRRVQLYGLQLAAAGRLNAALPPI